jgi:outer membrane protein TolC
MATTALNSQRIEIERLATLRYWDWVAAGKKLAIAQGMLQIAEVRDEALSHRVKHGEVSNFDRKDNLRTIIQRKSAAVAAERFLQKTALELSLFYRTEDGTPIVAGAESVPSHFPEIMSSKPVDAASISQVVPDSIQRNPDIQRIQANLEQMDIELQVSRNQILPKLDLKLGAFSDLGIANVSKFLIPTEYPYEFKISLSFELPLFMRAAEGRFAANSANLEKLNTQLGLQRDRIRMTIIDTGQVIIQAIKRVEYAKQEHALSQELEEGERTRFIHGDSNLLFVNIREQNTREAALREIDSVLEYFRAKAEYRAATAESIREPNPFVK